MDWLLKNKEWFFSGAGIFIIGILTTFFTKKNSKSVKQKQQSGSNSTNIQIGGDFKND